MTQYDSFVLFKDTNMLYILIHLLLLYHKTSDT